MKNLFGKIQNKVVSIWNYAFRSESHDPFSIEVPHEQRELPDIFSHFVSLSEAPKHLPDEALNNTKNPFPVFSQGHYRGNR